MSVATEAQYQFDRFSWTIQTKVSLIPAFVGGGGEKNTAVKDSIFISLYQVTFFPHRISVWRLFLFPKS